MFKDIEELEKFQAELATGATVESAAKTAKIEYKKAVDLCKEMLPPGAVISYELRVLAELAMRKGMGKLLEVVEEGPRMSYSIRRRGQGEDQIINETKTVHNTDLEAAKALCNLASDIMKIGIPLAKEAHGADSKKKEEQDKKKLFGPWRIKGLNC